ncbi:flagellar biosynthesis protein FlhF [Vogesella sp. LIG4]|uniref:flagellar biosynthesis protein FlhF n=1 Tax=Vogesella sp. LIG4 TaxID=1192162 RepID=UPI00081FCF9D|nr:flagellar biosynthesis protein FlhF [Vogesella sp. LIG4]SCK06187.1 flagellar biosynthesis protein FlhF [Vogesella sp. LIG4]
MVVRKFYGKTTRDALRQVREELGADALILSNRPTLGGGVEIMAVADADVSALATTFTPPAQPKPPRNTVPPAAQGTAAPAQPSRIPAASPPKPAANPSPAVNRALARTYAMPVEPLEEPPAAPPPRPAPAPAAAPAAAAPVEQELPQSFLQHVQQNTSRRPSTPPPAAARGSGAETDAEREQMSQELKQISDEIKQLRSLLQSQLAGFAWSDMEQRTPNRAELFRHLLTAGFSSALIRQLTQKLPPQYDGDVAQKWARSALIHNLKCMDPQHDPIEVGGIFALIGPTGVGKTTTVAKLAARATMRHGAQNVALITTDTYRIGAQDQLRIYGKILGVPVFSVQNEGDLQLTLADLTPRKIVLIDTVGMSQRDARVQTQLDMFSQAGRPVQRLLLLAANADGHTLEDVVRHYKGDGLAGAIVSKIDEALALGPSLDVVIRNRLRLFYVTNGQRVPEDIHAAHAELLIDRALRAAQQQSPFNPSGDELGLVNAAQSGWLG